MKVPFLSAFKPWICWIFGHNFKDCLDVSCEVKGRWVPAQYCDRCLETSNYDPKYLDNEAEEKKGRGK